MFLTCDINGYTVLIMRGWNLLFRFYWHHVFNLWHQWIHSINNEMMELVSFRFQLLNTPCSLTSKRWGRSALKLASERFWNHPTSWKWVILCLQGKGCFMFTGEGLLSATCVVPFFFSFFFLILFFIQIQFLFTQSNNQCTYSVFFVWS